MSRIAGKEFCSCLHVHAAGADDGVLGFHCAGTKGLRNVHMTTGRKNSSKLGARHRRGEYHFIPYLLVTIHAYNAQCLKPTFELNMAQFPETWAGVDLPS